LNHDNSNNLLVILCYYFKKSAFYNAKNILDAAILTYDHRNNLDLKLCVNLFSNRINDFRKKEVEIIQYLAKKYNLNHLQSIDMEMHSARLLVDDN